MLITAVVPTKNRAEALARAVASICAQARRPDELVVIDQSDGDEPRRGVEAACAATPQIKLVYVHDPRIAGLVAAKQAAVDVAAGDIVCFLEDDIVLERDYLLNIESGFAQQPGMLGCSGIVTNLPPLPRYYRELFHLFHRGIFYDRRVGIHGEAPAGEAPLVPSNYLSGGLSAYRREVFEAIAFDVANRFFALEDIDFSTRAFDKFGPRFYINRNARLAHYMSPVNRAVLGERQRRKVREFIVFYKKRSRLPGALSSLALLLAGLALEATYQSLSARRISPLSGYFAGIRDGMHWDLIGDRL